VPIDVMQLLATTEKNIVGGKLTPFDAPLKDNEGKVRLDKGTLNHDALNKMDYQVEGVVGKLPTK
jgi:basic membrane protein A